MDLDDQWKTHPFSSSIHHDSSSIKMDAKNNPTCEEPEEIPSPKLSDWLKSSTTPWRSPIRHGSMMMMPSTPLAWRFDSADLTLKEDFF
ncbi:protein PATRONUS 1-like [Brassica napus]|uniref:protein PATRONUS 1-like n=1 Tax=Brassica napus TaxID=3708 RepID=UPI000BBE7E8F|nr:protein PATRONUS 1-like [Brassica napus]